MDIQYIIKKNNIESAVNNQNNNTNQSPSSDNTEKNDIDKEQSTQNNEVVDVKTGDNNENGMVKDDNYDLAMSLINKISFRAGEDVYFPLLNLDDKTSLGFDDLSNAEKLYFVDLIIKDDLKNNNPKYQGNIGEIEYATFEDKDYSKEYWYNVTKKNFENAYYSLFGNDVSIRYENHKSGSYYAIVLNDVIEYHFCMCGGSISREQVLEYKNILIEDDIINLNVSSNIVQYDATGRSEVVKCEDYNIIFKKSNANNWYWYRTERV